MGGRGASSGISDKGNKYGSQYHTILEVDNIKFVEKNKRDSEPLMETMTDGRVYVQVGGEELLRIIFFDENNKRNKVIEYDKRHDEWHAHLGYFHNENDTAEHSPLSEQDKEILEKVRTLWDNRKRKT